MKYNTIIFDLDGTLLNTLDDLCDSVNAVMQNHGFPIRSLEEVRRFIGNGVGRLMRLAVPEECTDEEVAIYLKEFKEHYELNMENKTRPFDGIMELLLDLNRFNYNMAIVSNKFDVAVKVLAKTYFGNLIPVAIGESANVRRKPAPDSVFTAIKELGAELEKTIYVGDSDIDVETAKNAGIPCIGVTWGFRSREVLRNAGADYLIDTPKELLTLI
ncbi:MAG: HAD family hydrolase [Clostridiales bacterium]|nr:HAD family hydrolase [Clostridiales bacterium]